MTLVTPGGDRPYYVLRWRELGQVRQRSTETAVESAARRQAVELSSRLAGGMAGNLSWAAFCYRYEAEYLPTCKPKTRQCWDSARNWLDRLEHPRFLDEVRRRDCGRRREP